MNPGRVAAARTLLEVERGAHADELLERLAPLEGADRGLAWFLVFGVLRHRGQVDATLRPCLRQPLEGLEPEVREALRLGAFEALHARTPRHAVVDQAVRVIAALGRGRARGLVNAVLRRVREPKSLTRPEGLNHPAWLIERWDARYGADVVEAWCRANNEPPPLTVVARDDPQGLRAALEQAGCVVQEVVLGGRPLPGVFRVQGHEGPVTGLPGFEEGVFWVQDPAAVAVADLVRAPQGARVLDACAAPGGKTFRLIGQGYRVVAVDRDRGRLDWMRENLERLSQRVESAVQHDWCEGEGSELGLFDSVLVDAPCTALGTLRRHPEIRWRRKPEHLEPAAERELQILQAASSRVTPGGELIYAVCSPEPEEGPEVVARFLERNPDFRGGEVLRTDPPEADEDAFYGARLVRGET